MSRPDGAFRVINVLLHTASGRVNSFLFYLLSIFGLVVLLGSYISDLICYFSFELVWLENWRSFDRCLCCFTWDVNNANEDELWSIKFHPRSNTLSDHDWTGRWKPAGNTPDPDERICCFIHETDTWYASKWVARNFGWRTSAVGPADINKRQRKKKIPVGKKLSSLFLSLKEKGAKISIVFLELDDTGCRPLSSPLVSSQSRAGRGGDDDGTCHVIPTSYPSRSWHNFRFIPTSSSLYGFPVTN